MCRKFTLSTSVLPLAGSLADIRATRSSSGRAVAEPSSLSATHWLASDIYVADVYGSAEDKIRRRHRPL